MSDVLGTLLFTELIVASLYLRSMCIVSQICSDPTLFSLANPRHRVVIVQVWFREARATHKSKNVEVQTEDRELKSLSNASRSAIGASI